MLEQIPIGYDYFISGRLSQVMELQSADCGPFQYNWGSGSERDDHSVPLRISVIKRRRITLEIGVVPVLSSM